MANIKLAYATASNATITLASLASDSNLLAGRESAAVDNTTSLYLDILVSGKVTTGTSPTAAKSIEIWAVGSWDGTNWPDVFDGTESTETITSSDIKSSICRLIAAMATDATSNNTYNFGPVSLAGIFGGEVPPKVVFFVTHNTVAALNSVAGNHQIRLQPVYETLSGSVPAYTLPTATDTTLGGVKIGSGVTITDGVISVSTNYAATSHTHGNISSNGLINGNTASGQIVVTTTGGAVTTASSISYTQVSGLGTLATQNGTFSGTSSGTNTGDQTITLTGDVTGSGTGSFAATLSNTGVSAGTYTSVTVDAKGRVTAGSSPAVAYSSLSGVPSTFAPSAHKTSHATGGSDALSASDIGAAAASHTHSWSAIVSGLPTTLAGYGITDAQSQIIATGLLKGAGGGSISAAVAGTDYAVSVASGTGISVSSSSGAYTVSVKAYSTTIGDGSATSFTVTHNLNVANDVYVTVRDTGTNYYVYPDIKYSTANSIIIEFASAPTSNQYKVSIIGA